MTDNLIIVEDVWDKLKSSLPNFMSGQSFVVVVPTIADVERLFRKLHGRLDFYPEVRFNEAMSYVENTKHKNRINLYHADAMDNLRGINRDTHVIVDGTVEMPRDLQVRFR
jgi:hypothetical protein